MLIPPNKKNQEQIHNTEDIPYDFTRINFFSHCSLLVSLSSDQKARTSLLSAEEHENHHYKQITTHYYIYIKKCNEQTVKKIINESITTTYKEAKTNSSFPCWNKILWMLRHVGVLNIRICKQRFQHVSYECFLLRCITESLMQE